MAPLKILVVGPKEAGKTTIANFLSEQTDRLGSQERYHPTIGVRILELEKGKTNVEIWDVSGDQVYEACWPAVMKDANGIILVYNPESHVHESEAMLWYEWFIQNPNVDSSLCLVFEHSAGTSSNGSTKKAAAAKLRLPPAIHVVATTFDTPNVFKSEFDKLLQVTQEAASKQARPRK
ncbi:Rab-like protein 5-like, partial [Globisporangium splendens]